MAPMSAGLSTTAPLLQFEAHGPTELRNELQSVLDAFTHGHGTLVELVGDGSRWVHTHFSASSKESPDSSDSGPITLSNLSSHARVGRRDRVLDNNT